MTPSEKFRRARQAQRPRLKLTDVARQLGIIYRTAQTIENGRSRRMLLYAIETLAPQWGIPVEWFFDGHDNAVPRQNEPTNDAPHQVLETRRGYPKPSISPFFEPDTLPCHPIRSSREGPAATLNQPSFVPVPGALLPGRDRRDFPHNLLVFQCWVHDFEPRIRYGDFLLANRTKELPYNLLTIVQLTDGRVTLASYRPGPPAGFQALAPSQEPGLIFASTMIAGVYCIWSPEVRQSPNLEWLFNAILPA